MTHTDTVKNITAIVTAYDKSIKLDCTIVTDKNIADFLADNKDLAKAKSLIVNYPCTAIKGFAFDKQCLTVSLLNLTAIYNQGIKDATKHVSSVKMAQALNIAGIGITRNGTKQAITKDYLKTACLIYVKHALKNMAWINNANDKIAVNPFYYAIALNLLCYAVKTDVKSLKADIIRQIAVMRKSGLKGNIDTIQKAIA